VVTLTPRPLHSRGKSPGTYLTEGWVGPRADLDEVAKGKNPYTSRE